MKKKQEVVYIDEDRDEMMQRALQNGVQRFFVPAIDSTYTERMFQLEKDYPNETKQETTMIIFFVLNI